MNSVLERFSQALEHGEIRLTTRKRQEQRDADYEAERLIEQDRKHAEACIAAAKNWVNTQFPKVIEDHVAAGFTVIAWGRYKPDTPHWNMAPAEDFPGFLGKHLGQVLQDMGLVVRGIGPSNSVGWSRYELLISEIKRVTQ